MSSRTSKTEIDEIVANYHSDLDSESLAAPKIIDKDGILRFRPNRVLTHMYDTNTEGWPRSLGRPIGLNELWTWAMAHGVYREEMQEFYRLLGYSLSGFQEIDWSRLPERKSP